VADLLIDRSKLNNVQSSDPLDFHPSEILRQIAKYGHELDNNRKTELKELGFDFSSQLVRTQRPQNLDKYVDGGIFRFHYTLTGEDAVSSKDEDDENYSGIPNGVPDYVDLMINTFYSIGIIDFDSLEFFRPPSDSWYTNLEDGGSDHYDVYIFKLEAGYYGYVQAEEYAQGNSPLDAGNNEFSPVKETRAMSSFMAMRNNYNDFDGIENENIMVTSAHEFFHAVQYGYNGWESGWLLESTAVWMEEKHYDDVNDCYQYFKEFFEEPEKGLNHDVARGYASYIYWSYLTDNIVDEGLIKRIFERSMEFDSYDGMSGYDQDYSISVIKQALKDYRQDFQRVTNHFFTANALLTSNKAAGIYQYAEADSFPLKTPTFSKEISEVTNSGTDIKAQSVEMTGARYYKVDTSDTTLKYIKIGAWKSGAEDVSLDLHAILDLDNIISYEVISASERTLEVSSTKSVIFFVSAFGPDSGSVSYDLRVSRVDADSDTSSSFDLLVPSTDTKIIISNDNLADELVLGWENPINFTGTYYFLLTDSLDLIYSLFYDQCTFNNKGNSCSIPYHYIEAYMHSEGLERVSGTWDIIAQDESKTIYSNNGPFKLTIDGTSVNIGSGMELYPTKFRLYPNSPNPFNPSTRISYDLKEQVEVTLIVYDLLGNKIKTLVNQSQDTGNNIAVWDGTDDFGRTVSAGVYLYRITAGEFVQTQKMLFLK
tara:strand:- start:786 stop:2912 length:2127 start_codon:yes stop_codon:yes gene_type:complete